MNLARDTDRDALASELIAIFPAPGHIERVWLYTELQAILKAAPWVRPHVGGDAIDHVLEELRLQADRLTPSREKGASITLLVGKFGNAGAIIGHGTASAALRRLAGLVWIALRRWWSAGHLPCTVSDELTSAVRAAIRDFRSKAFWVLDPVLAELKSVEDMQGAIRAMSRLESSPHQSLRHAWNNGLRQILTDERFDRGVSERPIAKRTGCLPPLAERQGRPTLPFRSRSPFGARSTIPSFPEPAWRCNRCMRCVGMSRPGPPRRSQSDHS